MSMYDNDVQAGAQKADYLWWTLALARYTTQCREELGLTIEAAAELTGLETSEWCALEEGWVPAEVTTLRAIAEVLEVSWPDYRTWALLSAYSQRSS